jgi:hypothetical protein
MTKPIPTPPVPGPAARETAGNPDRSAGTAGSGGEPPPGRPWPSWACWIVSGLLLFHMAALLANELAGHVPYSTLESDVGRRFWWYIVLIVQDYPHGYFAPEPDPATPVVLAEIQFAGGERDREIRIPDPSARPRIRFLRQIALAWHLTHERSLKEETAWKPLWAESYARHLCRTNPGCTRVKLFLQMHKMPDPAAVAGAVSRGEKPDLEPVDFSSIPQLIGAYSCDEL